MNKYDDEYEDEDDDIRLGCAILIVSALCELAFIGWVIWLFT